MSVQLIVYPQNYEGFSNSTNIANAVLVDGINFSTVNASTSFFVGQPNGAQEAINFYNPTLPVNTWKRYKVGSSGISESGGNLSIAVLPSTNQQGILQKLSNLTIGGIYNVEIDCTLLINGNIFNLSIFSGTVLQSIQPFPITGSGTIISFQFTANSTEDTIVIGGKFGTGNLITSNISISTAPTQPSGAVQILGDGQVILDLYEDEDLPLTLSVDDFKNVAEKVQSYSKAFNLPATKRNNRIFNHIFEITREVESAGSLLFNPYKKTKCVLKQDSFILFEGYLRMLNITDKEGEISYDVNLYSEVIALADILQDRFFRDLDFTELAHSYNKDNIKRSWNDTGNSIAYTNPSTSGFRDDYTTLRYPFVDWNRQWILANNTGASGPTNGNPQLPSLETAFRPFINIKYLIDRIFEATDFTYESAFFNEADFLKLYMDFNWGSDNSPISLDTSGFGLLAADQAATSSFTEIIFQNNNFAQDIGYDTLTGIITATYDNQTYFLSYNLVLDIIGTSNYDADFQVILTRASGFIEPPINVTQITGNAPTANFISGSTTQILNLGDTLKIQFKSSTVANNTVSIDASSFIYSALDIISSAPAATNDIFLQTLRGETGQWEFLKGIITMFNLVTIPDEDNPNNIKIEPYQDVFVNSTDSVPLNWTEKIDVSQMKLTPLTDLNRSTMFKFVEDDDDSAFMQYKNQVGGHLYGSQLYATTDQFNILEGEDEIVAEPFAATIVKPLEDNFPQFVTPAIYAMNDDESTQGFENSPRIMFNNGVKPTGASYYIPAQNGLLSENQTNFLQFSHLSEIPTSSANPSTTLDFHFGICQLFPGVGVPTTQNLFNLYWLPYFNELYNPNTRTMTLKVNLSPADINTFKFNDTVFIKNKVFRVNKIDYKPNDLATVEFILIP